jgi:hypothetical protein
MKYRKRFFHVEPPSYLQFHFYDYSIEDGIDTQKAFGQFFGHGLPQELQLLVKPEISELEALHYSDSIGYGAAGCCPKRSENH